MYLAWYHNGFSDEGNTLLGVCRTSAVAAGVIKDHQDFGDRAWEFRGRASWWVEEREMKGDA